MVDVPDMDPVFLPVIDKKELQERGHYGQVINMLLSTSSSRLTSETRNIRE